MAIQSLIATLDLPQEVVEERLRITSIQPSETSTYSVGMNSIDRYTMPIPETEEQRWGSKMPPPLH